MSGSAFFPDVIMTILSSIRSLRIDVNKEVRRRKKEPEIVGVGFSLHTYFFPSTQKAITTLCENGSRRKKPGNLGKPAVDPSIIRVASFDLISRDYGGALAS